MMYSYLKSYKLVGVFKGFCLSYFILFLLMVQSEISPPYQGSCNSFL